MAGISDPRIHATTLIITSNLTTIVDSESTTSPISSPYLKVRITPTRNGKDIAFIQITYLNHNANPSQLNDEIVEPNVFETLVHCVKGDGDSLIDRVVKYMRALPTDDVTVIVHEYTKYIQDGVILDGFIAGIAAYMTLLLLNENAVFTHQMPFQFSTPLTVRSGAIVNRNMFRYLSLPLTSLSRTAEGILLQLVLFVQGFINMWEPLFCDGPVIGFNNEGRMAIEVISGFSQHVASELAQTRALNDAMTQKLGLIENRLQSYVDDSLSKMRREVNNLLLDTKKSIHDLTVLATSQLSNVDIQINQRVGAIVKTDLETQIKSMIQMEIEACHDRINELVGWYAEEHVRKGIRSMTAAKDMEANLMLRGLEHRIEILYDNLNLEWDAKHLTRAACSQANLINQRLMLSESRMDSNFEMPSDSKQFHVEGLERISNTKSHDGNYPDEPGITASPSVQPAGEPSSIIVSRSDSPSSISVDEDGTKNIAQRISPEAKRDERIDDRRPNEGNHNDISTERRVSHQAIRRDVKGPGNLIPWARNRINR